jgi:hypothetical protein
MLGKRLATKRVRRKRHEKHDCKREKGECIALRENKKNGRKSQELEQRNQNELARQVGCRKTAASAVMARAARFSRPDSRGEV